MAQGGETLQMVAAQTWGDPSLWYKFAEANGLSADTTLTEGQTLTLPAGIVRSHSNANTFKPYDAAEAIGNTAPPTPKPKKNNKCGVFGQVLLVAIAVAVTIATSGAALAALSPAVGSVGAGIGAMVGATSVAGVGVGAFAAAGAIGGAVGSMVSQGLGVATGIQQSFSWKGVALAALQGGIGGAMTGVANGAQQAIKAADLAGTTAKLTQFQKFMTSGDVLATAVRGAGASAFGQGIGVITGLQDKFGWAGVAAAGVSAVAGSRVGQMNGFDKLSTFNQRFFSSMAADVANAATRSVLEGSDFGDNVIAALPDIIGQTIGGIIADGLAGRADPAAGDGEGAEAEPAPGEDGDGSGATPMGGPPWLLASAAIVADPSLAQAFAAGGVDPLAPLPDPLAPLSDPPASLPHIEVDVGGLLAASTEVTFQGTPIYEGDILVVGTRRSGSSSLEATIQQIGDVIAGGEGGYESYNTGTKKVPGGKVGHSYMYPRAGTVTGKTVNQILSTESLPGTDPRRMFATGKYQTIIPTLRLAKDALNLTGNELYTPELQERVFAEYLLKAQAPGLYGFIANGKGTAVSAQYAASKTWASIAVPKGLPDGNGVISNGSRSYYESSANHAVMGSTNRLRAMLFEIQRTRH